MLGVLNCLRVVSVGNHFLWIRDIPVGFILLADAHFAQLLLPFMTGIVLFFFVRFNVGESRVAEYWMHCIEGIDTYL
jgi:hypothetical protein